MPCVTVETLSGHSMAVRLSSSATIGDLRGAIGVELDVPSKLLQLVVGTSLLPHDESVKLEAAGVQDGTQVSAIVRQCPPFPVLPSTFEVMLQTSRQRLGFRPFSSSFTMIYTLKLDVPKNLIQANVIRLNDTDHFDFDGQKGTWKGDRGHCMAGTTPIQEQSLPCFHLGNLLRDWMDSAEVVLESEKQLWTIPKPPSNGMVKDNAITEKSKKDVEENEDGTEEEDEDEVSEDGTEKKTKTKTKMKKKTKMKTYAGDQSEFGWFVAPSSDCFELYVNAPFPVSGPMKRNCLRIARVLVDASGSPVRVALYHDNRADNVPAKDHLQKANRTMARDGSFLLEEFDVTLKLDPADDPDGKLTY